ncbi:MAG TPA: peptide ABC transporter substrate-binding protein, partial [Chloroflexota bacterium]|nr:peptide ABC transporter substrate-binding protein [Chloroflexota bacterium]
GPPATMVQQLIFNGLVRLDTKLRVVPDGASSWSISKNHRVYTFHIRPNLRFADGSRVTAYDFAWSMNRAFRAQFLDGNTDYFLRHIVGGIAVTNGSARTVSGIKVLGRGTLQITTDTPTAAFLDQLTYQGAAVVPARLIRKYGSSWTNHAVGTGPFFVRNIKSGSQIDLSPNRYYWRGKPHVNIRIVLAPSASVAYDMYRAGKLDIAGSQQFPVQRIRADQRRPDFHEAPKLQTDYLVSNERHKPFDSVDVRRAFALAFDRYTLANGVLRESRYPARGIMPPGLPGYDPGARGQYLDPKLSARLLARAGYPNGNDFPKVSLSVDASDPYGESEALALTRAWKKNLHVNVGITKLDQTSYSSRLTALNFQLAFVEWAQDYPDPQDFLSLQLQTGASHNIGGFSNRQFDQLTSRADTLFGNDRMRYRLYRQAETIALGQAAWIVMDWGKTVCLIRPSVHGLILNGDGLTAPNWAAVTMAKS